MAQPLKYQAHPRQRKRCVARRTQMESPRELPLLQRLLREVRRRNTLAVGGPGWTPSSSPRACDALLPDLESISACLACSTLMDFGAIGRTNAGSSLMRL